MAPGSVSSVSSSSSSSPSRDMSPSGASELPGADKQGPHPSRVRIGQRNPTMLRMVLEALQAREKRQGTSVVAIKVYIQHKYPTVDTNRFKYLLKQALDTGMRRGLLTRPANSKAKGATGSFKLVPRPKVKRTCTSISRRRATEAEARGKTKGVCEKSEPSAHKVQNSAASQAKRKMTAMAHTDTVVQGARTKAPVPPQDMGHKAQPTPRVRKTKTPKDPKRAGSPPKTSCKALSRKAEASN
ncbi:histone H1.8 isoform X3 [Mesocricetus auratus]|uniref:Histone H1.8 n=1 Tax=Mesocricetus auratus TaxID=10036 RepID=A0A3Q0CIY6_MESAU|nr:histone H1.8 isoform X3 [Mesocricetus auratus]